MRHDIAMAGAAFRLRPLTLADAGFVVELRTDPRAARFINPTSPHVADQERWTEQYLARPGDYCFVVERLDTHHPEGMVGIYHEDRARRSAEWGRWVLVPGSLAAAESALLVYRIAFEVLGLDLLYCRTVAANQQVVSFHSSCGLVTHARLPNFVSLDGVAHDVVEQRMTRAAWPAHAPALARSAAAAARILRR